MLFQVLRYVGKVCAARQARQVRGLRVGTAAAVVLALAGCSDSTLNPVDWWHSLEGGPLDETRPPPPNADAPYPKLGNVPAKGSAPDMTAPNQIAKALIADRENAHYDASLSPLQATPPANAMPPPGQTQAAPQAANGP